ncbi:uncharacterized protein LOC114269328 isoform X2 [Camellia sinensis]|uniref:uncharacterized protein LOC114269328 isoform X2 n=1 Tax=Camellia sinensis TaxID=4442 RepID=UPI001036A0A5|nr:uncharacterized protein LOC114269328 isoform X2 [Camellia sinensis]
MEGTVTDSASIASLVDYIKNKFGKFNILVNNAGVNGVIMDAESFTSSGLELRTSTAITSGGSQMMTTPTTTLPHQSVPMLDLRQIQEQKKLMI